MWSGDCRLTQRKGAHEVRLFLVSSRSGVQTSNLDAVWHVRYLSDSIDWFRSRGLNRRSHRRHCRHSQLHHKRSCRRCTHCSSGKGTIQLVAMSKMVERPKPQTVTQATARLQTTRTFSSEYSRKNSETGLSQTRDLNGVLIWLIPPHTKHRLMAIVFVRDVFCSLYSSNAER